MKKETKKWSIYQEAIFKFVKSTKKSLVVNAVAGSGKTTTIVEAAKIARKKGKSVLFLAFNKSIATELSARMEGTGIECKTLHSHGFRAIQQYLGRGVSVFNNKWSSYIESSYPILESTKFDNNAEKYAFVRQCIRLLDLARINLLKKGDFDSLYDLAEHHGFDLEDIQYEIVNDILGICYRTDKVIDYTDMITTPIMSDRIKIHIPKYDVIFVDEAQDLSKAQRELVLASLEKGGRFIAVGDRKQAINGFAGADVESFNTLAEIAGNELPLSVCYRCGKNIIEEAKSIVPQIESFEGCIDGNVIHTKDMKTLSCGDMVLCRKSAPLVGLCLKLIANGNSATVNGKDLAEGLKAMVLRTKSKQIPSMLSKLENEIDKVRRKLEKKKDVENIDEHPQMVNIKDKVECINLIAANCKNVKEVLEKLESLFSDLQNGRGITLSTVHKAKGLESDNVYIILPKFLPMVRKRQQMWELEQEYNLKYVAITRAKKNLYYVDLGDLTHVDVPCGI